MKLHLNPVVIETFARLEAALAFVEMMNDGIPTVADKEHQYVDKLASEGRWEHAEYVAERDILNRKFDSWIPIVAAYSATVFLHSIVETQLDSLADHIGKKRDSRLLVKHIHGKGIERAAIFLERVLSIDVKADLAWGRLRDLQSLRDIIVHRGGSRGESDEGRKKVDDLVKRYPQALGLRRIDGFREQIWMSMNLCRDFAQDIAGFFERIFKLSGLPNQNGQLDGDSG